MMCFQIIQTYRQPVRVHAEPRPPVSAAKTSVDATDKSNLNPRASAFVVKLMDPEQHDGYFADRQRTPQKNADQRL